jgi:type IV secretory pathway VirD2 relaxase
MKQMEADLGTRLDWIAVDHHNTGRPHTHIIVRGVTDDGKTLNIAGDLSIPNTPSTGLRDAIR